VSCIHQVILEILGGNIGVKQTQLNNIYTQAGYIPPLLSIIITKTIYKRQMMG